MIAANHLVVDIKVEIIGTILGEYSIAVIRNDSPGNKLLLHQLTAIKNSPAIKPTATDNIRIVNT